MTDPASVQESLEGTLKDEILRMYAELFGYAPEWLDRAPAGAGAAV